MLYPFAAAEYRLEYRASSICLCVFARHRSIWYRSQVVACDRYEQYEYDGYPIPSLLQMRDVDVPDALQQEIKIIPDVLF